MYDYSHKNHERETTSDRKRTMEGWIHAIIPEVQSHMTLGVWFLLCTTLEDRTLAQD